MSYTLRRVPCQSNSAWRPIFGRYRRIAGASIQFCSAEARKSIQWDDLVDLYLPQPVRSIYEIALENK